MEGNGDLFETVRKLAEGKKKISPGIRDQILFAALTDVRKAQKAMEEKLNRIWPIYQALALLGGILAPVATALIVYILVGKR